MVLSQFYWHVFYVLGNSEHKVNESFIIVLVGIGSKIKTTLNYLYCF